MIAAVFMFVVYLVVFGILFWICDYAAANFLPAEFAPKAHVILVILFALLILAFILSLVGAVPLALPGLHPYHF